MKSLAFVFGLLLSASSALAQQPPSQAEMRGAITAFQAQLQAAQQLHAGAEMRGAVCNDEIGKLRTRVQELEAKLAETQK